MNLTTAKALGLKIPEKFWCAPTNNRVNSTPMGFGKAPQRPYEHLDLVAIAGAACSVKVGATIDGRYVTDATSYHEPFH
jgi:hypothetical protein